VSEVIELMTEQQASKFLELSPKTLQKYRMQGGGPKFIKIGRKIRYRRKHLDEWLETRTFENTGQVPKQAQSS
jgi:predicted DNA-binding transcriptional regulator AlpA